MIKELTIITSQGVKTYRVGNTMPSEIDRVVDSIQIESLYFQGDPYEHYCILDKNGDRMAAINCLAPCEIIYQ